MWNMLCVRYKKLRISVCVLREVERDSILLQLVDFCFELLEHRDRAGTCELAVNAKDRVRLFEHSLGVQCC